MIEAWLAPILLAVQTVVPPAAPPEAHDLPASAPDHFVSMESERQCSDCRPYRRTVTRSGPWVREEIFAAGIHQIHYSDFETNTSFSVVHGRGDRYQWFTVQRDSEANARYRLRRQRTGSNVIWLGEPCEIWLMTSPIYDGDSCETSDGVQLWSRQLTGTGGVLSSMHAVSVERRPVRRDEARPPADFFGGLPSLAADAADGAGAFEVRFVFGRGRDRVEELFRRSGRARFTRRQAADDSVEYWGSDERVTFTFGVGADGRPVRLNVSQSDPDESQPRRETWEPVPGRRWRLLYGERCRWQQLAEDDRPDEPYQCRTESGIPLMMEDRSVRGEPILYRARSLRRGPLEPGAFAIPADASDWASWGVAPPS